MSVLLAAAGAIIPEIVRAVQGAKQKREGDALDASLTRPEAKVQNESYEALDIARLMASGRDAPGMTTAKEGIESTFGNAIAETQKFANPDTSALYEAKANALLGIQDRNTAFRESNLNGLMQALNNMAQQKQNVFQFNEVQPYYEGTAAAARLREAGITNQFNTLSNIGSGLTDTATLAALEKYLKAPAIDGFKASQFFGGEIIEPENNVRRSLLATEQRTQ